MNVTAEYVLTVAEQHGFRTITAAQAEQIARYINQGFSAEQASAIEVVDLSIVMGLRSAENENTALLATVMLDDLPAPDGFAGAEQSEWERNPNLDVIERCFGLEIPAGDDTTVIVTVTDRIIDGKIVRQRPTTIVSVEKELSRDELLTLADALTIAARKVAHLEAADE